MGKRENWRGITLSGRPAWESKEVDEYTWDRVQRMRKEGHPLICGGQFRRFKPQINIALNEPLKGLSPLSKKLHHLS